ncbi:MAG: RnfABCDGE type electron transport complex subunit D [Methanosarcinaceae archaeon]|nr:RnfABCDGE type electron transport complex subunit D [Methanosarcinaceae archaeon]
MTFTISAPPHWKSNVTVSKMMWGKVLALVPVSLIAIYFFGLSALGIIIAGILGAVATEFIIQKAFNQKVTIADGHAVLIGFMLALILPANVPLWLPVIGSLFAVGIGKHAFGGIGSYVFNPVLVAWVFLTLAWTQIMTPATLAHLGQLSDLILDNGAGFLIGVSPIALIGGVYLIAIKYVDWRVPLSYFVTTILLTLLIKEDLSYVITGAFLFGVLFLATDTPTSPVTRKGRIIYGITCGVLTVLYGYFANYTFATFYGLILANGVAPLIENNTLPKPFGGVKK